MRTGLFDLDSTLDSGQAFRWTRDLDKWTGVLDGKVVRVRQNCDGLEVDGDISEEHLASYFRLDDDLDTIYTEISQDDHMADLIDRFRGMRLIRQDVWECCASYILATFTNVPRIKKMIETYAAPMASTSRVISTPSRPRKSYAPATGISPNVGWVFRDDRLLEFARSVSSGEFDLDRLKQLDYNASIRYLLTVNGIGRKVADCIALFSLDHLEAVPVDVRIARAMKDIYGVEGNYDKVSGFAREHFGRYAGYAQEYLYIAEDRGRKKDLGTVRRPTPDRRIRGP